MTTKNPVIHHQIDMLYREHNDWLTAFLYKRMGCSHSASDLAQDTYLRLLINGRMQEPMYARGYLARVAKGLMIDLYRRRRIEATYLEQLALHPQEFAPSAETQALLIDTLVELDKLLHSLPEKVRRAFLMHRLDGLSYRDIAEQLGVSVSSVEKYITRALQTCLLATLNTQQ